MAPKKKQSIEEKRLKKKLYEQNRRARIKSDPIRREALKQKDRERYLRQKQNKVKLPLLELSPRHRKKVQKRNRKNYIAYKARQHAKKNTKKRKTNTQKTQPKRNKSTTDFPVHQNENEPLSQPDQTTLHQRSSLHPSNLRINRSPSIEIDVVHSCSVPYQRQSGECRSRSVSIDDWNNERSNPQLMLLRSKTNTNQSISSSNHDSPSARSPFQTPPCLSPIICEANSSSSSFCPASPSSDGSIEFHKTKLRQCQRNKSRLINKLHNKISKLHRDKEMYRKRLERFQNIVSSPTCKIVKVNDIPKQTLNTQKKKETRHREKKELRSIVTNFFEDDENSRLCPGKKDTITKNSLKKQKRYLNDTLKNLHLKYLELNHPPISYVQFTRLKPFWIVTPDPKKRDTCVCQTHANMELLVTSLKHNRIIKENTITELLKTICCEKVTVDCLQRKCTNCKNKTVMYQQFDNSNLIAYWAWERKNKTYVKDNVTKTAKIVDKIQHSVYPKTAIAKFEKDLAPFMNHCANIKNQYQSIKHVKDNMSERECLVHIDFSENYSTKYNSEVQSVHFGASRSQMTLHTSVIYTRKNEELKTQSFCTISTSLRHDAIAVWAHLEPILDEIQESVPNITTLHIVSDSPSAQYRNKTMFYVITRLQSYCSKLTRVLWHYCECGHGKGAPDGVGGVLKKTADQLVAYSKDITDIDSLVGNLKKSAPGVKIKIVEEHKIDEKVWLLPDNIKTFRGTMKVHQVVWTEEIPNRLALRSLTCIEPDCINYVTQCPHGKHVGFHDIGENNSIISNQRVFQDEPTSGPNELSLLENPPAKSPTNVFMKTVSNNLESPPQPLLHSRYEAIQERSPLAVHRFKGSDPFLLRGNRQKTSKNTGKTWPQTLTVTSPPSSGQLLHSLYDPNMNSVSDIENIPTNLFSDDLSDRVFMQNDASPKECNNDPAENDSDSEFSIF